MAQDIFALGAAPSAPSVNNSPIPTLRSGKLPALRVSSMDAAAKARFLVTESTEYISLRCRLKAALT